MREIAGQINRRHGMSHLAIYKRWSRMVERCTNPHCREYADYGGRGITVCEQWRDFTHFYADMGMPPPGMQIERLDKNGPYAPGNCSWATAEQQAQNKRNNTHLIFQGLRLTVEQWAKRLGIPRSTLWLRLEKGLSVEQVLTTPNEEGLHSDSRPYPPEVVTAVTAAYERGGTHHAQELFPTVAVRSIVECYKHYQPRQVRWTGAQQIEAARMAGLVSATAQARWFGRPNAYEGSIKSLWAKRFQCAPRDMHGLPVLLAWPLMQPGCPAVLVKH